MDRPDFDALVGQMAAPMAVVTTAIDGERAGCLVGFHCQCSLEPRRYAVWLSKANHTYRVALLASHLAVHFLSRDHRDLAELFGTKSGDDVDKFTGCQYRAGPGGVPLLDRCPNRLVVRRHTVLDDGSDHVCVVSEPVEAQFDGAFEPLRLPAVADLVPGHTADERPKPRTERSG